MTRHGSLERRREGLRPHHADAEAAEALIARTSGTLEQKIAGALEPTRRMRGAAVVRYAEEAADAIAPLVVVAAASTSVDLYAWVNCVLDTVVDYGKQFPIAAQRRFAKRSAIAIEKERLTSAYAAERSIARRVQAPAQPRQLTATAGIAANVEPSL
jgi:predicted HicB family RNase H-like nuclease